MANMNEYFAYAAKANVPRCSDMDWYKRGIAEGQLKRCDLTQEFGASIDPLRDTIVHYGLWLDENCGFLEQNQLTTSEALESWITAKGAWESEAALTKSFDATFLSRFIRPISGPSIAELDVAYLHSCRNVLEHSGEAVQLLRKARGQHVRYFLESHLSRLTAAETCPISHIHLQGMGKRLANSLDYLVS